jgi:rRNA maturation protein Nop10
MINILFNEVIGEYTLKEEINNVKSVRNVPIRFKLNDKTAKFRKEILKKEIFNI